MSAECESATQRRADTPWRLPTPYAARMSLIAWSSCFRGGIVPAAAVVLATADARSTAAQATANTTYLRRAGTARPPASAKTAARYTPDPLGQPAAACLPSAWRTTAHAVRKHVSRSDLATRRPQFPGLSSEKGR